MPGSIRAIATLAAALCSLQAAGQDGEENDTVDRTPQRCITASRIDSTDVVDDNTIIFYMRGGGQDFVNYLPQRCPNLAREERFGYQVRSRRLCNSETITVLERAGGFPGFTCRLGEFHPVTTEAIEEMLRIAENGGQGAIEVEQVDPPEEEGDDAAETDQDAGD